MSHPSDTRKRRPDGARAKPSGRSYGPAPSGGPAPLRTFVAACRRIPRPVRWGLLAAAVLVVVSMVVDASVYANKVHAGVTIAGQSVSGLSREEATVAVTQALEGTASRKATLVSGDRTWEVTPASVGLQTDVEAAVSAALDATRDGNVFVDQAHKLTLYFEGTDIPLTGVCDEAKLSAVIEDVADDLDKPAVDAGIAIEAGGVVREIEAQEGLTVDREALRQEITEALCDLAPAEISVPIIVDKPEVRNEDNAKAVAQTRTMVSAPLTLTSLDQAWTFSAAQVARFIDFKTEAVDGVSTLVPYISAEKMGPTLQGVSKQMSSTPLDARIEGDDQKAWVVPSTPGRALKSEETAAALNEAALKTTGRTAEAVVQTTEPEFTTEEAESMGIKDLLSVRTTAFTGTKNRQNNVRVATAAINKGGANFLAPGEEFSFLKLVGDRTAEQGYKEAPGIQANGSLEGELGGGICQVATTVFNTAFFAGLKVTERRNHTIYISHYPEGRDAAVTTDSAGIVDLKFVNDTGNYIWIRGDSDGVTTTFWIYGTSDGRKVTFRNSGKYNVGPDPPVWKTVDNSLAPGKTVVLSPGQPYLNVKVTRWITWPDGTVKEDVFLSKYPERPKIVHVGPGTT